LPSLPSAALMYFENFYRTIGLDFPEHDNLTLVDYVNGAKNLMNSPMWRSQ